MRPVNDSKMHVITKSPQRNDANSYQIGACKDLIEQDPMTDLADFLPGQGVRPFEICGVRISGVDYRLIDTISLRLNIPLNSGRRSLRGPKAEMKIKIDRDTTAELMLVLKRNEQGALALKDFSLCMNRSIEIQNPSSSLKPGASDKLNAIKDHIASVRLKTIDVDDDGDVFINGKIRAFGFIKKRLPKKLMHVSLPALDEAFLESLGLVESCAGEKKSIRLKKQFDVNKVLADLGALTSQSSYRLDIEGDESQMAFYQGNTYVAGPKEPLAISLGGSVLVSTSGVIELCVEREKSQVNCSLGSYQPEIHATINHLGRDKKLDVTIDGDIKGVAHHAQIDTFAKQRVTGMLPRRRLGERSKDQPQGIGEFNTSVSAERVDINGHAKLEGVVGRSVEKLSGSVGVDVKVHSPQAKTVERGMIMDGVVTAHFSLDRFEYDRRDGLSVKNGKLGFGLHPSKKTRATFPELKSVDFDYDLSIKKGGKARMKPPEYGITRFLRPIINFEGHKERIDGKPTKTSLHTIGSPGYFKQIEKIADVKIGSAEKVKLLVDGVNSLPERLRLIEEATEHIFFQTLVFKDDASGWQYAKALVSAKQRGVRVCGVVDSLGNMPTLSGIEEPHPIYQYLIENGVELKIYNGFVEESLRILFGVVKKHRGIFKIEGPKSLHSIAQLLRFLERVVNVVEDEANELPDQDKTRIKKAVHTLFNGKLGVSPNVAVQELRQALAGNLTTLSELLLIIKRMGHASYRWHEKYLVVDHERAIVGGMNIADEYLRGGTNEKVVIDKKTQPAWRDTDVLLEGKVVREVYKNFRRNWFHLTHERLKYHGPTIASQGQYSVGILQHRPLEDGDHKVLNFLLYNLRTLKPGEKAWFETAYFLPRGVLRALQKEIVACAKRGVDVRILTNSKDTSDFGALVEAADFDVREIVEAGGRVFLRNQDRMVHAKVMVLGDQLTIVGSWNCDNRSASHDSEDVCLIYDKKTTQEMTDILLEDMMAQSDEVTLADVENRTLGQEIRSAGMLLLGELV